MHRLAHRLVAAERERKIRDAARDMSMREVLPDPARRLDIGDAIAVVLLHAGGDGKDIRIENNVLRRKADLVDKNVVGARTDLCLAFERIGLSRFIERHDPDGWALTAHQEPGRTEGGFALLY